LSGLRYDRKIGDKSTSGNNNNTTIVYSKYIKKQHFNNFQEMQMKKVLQTNTVAYHT